MEERCEDRLAQDVFGAGAQGGGSESLTEGSAIGAEVRAAVEGLFVTGSRKPSHDRKRGEGTSESEQHLVARAKYGSFLARMDEFLSV